MEPFLSVAERVAKSLNHQFVNSLNNDGNRFPDQSVHELVELRILHRKEGSNFAARSPVGHPVLPATPKPWRRRVLSAVERITQSLIR